MPVLTILLMPTLGSYKRTGRAGPHLCVGAGPVRRALQPVPLPDDATVREGGKKPGSSNAKLNSSNMSGMLQLMTDDSSPGRANLIVTAQEDRKAPSVLVRSRDDQIGCVVLFEQHRLIYCDRNAG